MSQNHDYQCCKYLVVKAKSKSKSLARCRNITISKSRASLPLSLKPLKLSHKHSHSMHLLCHSNHPSSEIYHTPKLCHISNLITTWLISYPEMHLCTREPLKRNLTNIQLPCFLHLRQVFFIFGRQAILTCIRINDANWNNTDQPGRVSNIV